MGRDLPQLLSLLLCSTHYGCGHLFVWDWADTLAVFDPVGVFWVSGFRVWNAEVLARTLFLCRQGLTGVVLFGPGWYTWRLLWERAGSYASNANAINSWLRPPTIEVYHTLLSPLSRRFPFRAMLCISTPRLGYLSPYLPFLPSSTLLIAHPILSSPCKLKAVLLVPETCHKTHSRRTAVASYNAPVAGCFRTYSDLTYRLLTTRSFGPDSTVLALLELH